MPGRQALHERARPGLRRGDGLRHRAQVAVLRGQRLDLYPRLRARNSELPRDGRQVLAVHAAHVHVQRHLVDMPADEEAGGGGGSDFFCRATDSNLGGLG